LGSYQIDVGHPAPGASPRRSTLIRLVGRGPSPQLGVLGSEVGSHRVLAVPDCFEVGLNPFVHPGREGVVPDHRVGSGRRRHRHPAGTLGQRGGRGERVAGAARPTDCCELPDPEDVRDRGDVGRRVGHPPATMAIGRSEPGPVVPDEPDPELGHELVVSEPSLGRAEEATPGLAVHEEDGPADQVAVLGEGEGPPIGRAGPLQGAVGRRHGRVPLLKAALSVSECHSLRDGLGRPRADSMLREPPVQRGGAASVRSKKDSGMTKHARSLE
jgi:hypothetical protein